MSNSGSKRNVLSHPLTLISLLTVFAVAIHGYHPYAEDGGLYVAGVRKLLDPSLYPAWTGFVTGLLRLSLFAPLIAALVRILHVPLAYALLGAYCASSWATLYGGWMLVCRMTPLAAARYGGVTLLACWLTLPIAGTSLMLMDPYVTARSLSTPLVLVSLAWALDAVRGRRRAWMFCGLALLAATLMHPLMAGYGIAAVAVLSCVASPRQWMRRWGPALLCLGAVSLATVLQVHARAETAAYVRIVATRYYWFPFDWQWYEQVGLMAPLLLLFLMRRRSPFAYAGVALGVIAGMVSLLFSHAAYATHLVARMQPLRAFQIVYELMILLLGAWLGEHILRAHSLRWALLLIALGGTMFAVQRSTFPNSAHLEWPWAVPVNPWEQAFLWVRENTPRDALFALDARYITQGRREDAQCFRAIAERSAVADYSKDGGEAAITPSLTDLWVQGQTAQSGLEAATDSERLVRLRPLGVGWVVLETAGSTAWQCPYVNRSVRVCRVP